MLSLLMARRGWRVTFLGADTPFDSLESTVRTLRPSVVVLATYDAAVFHANATRSPASPPQPGSR